MAQSGTINLFLKNTKIDITVLLNFFQNSGWNFNTYGKIQYLPLGDKDFEWQFEDIANQNKVIQIIMKKYEKNEIVGILFNWKETDIGLTSLIYPNLDKITFSLNTNRKVIDNVSISDFSWYIERIIPIFTKLDFLVERIECLEE